ncbi:MAG TPA: tRNA-dihydrouridine synthase family protein [Pseudobdellovibrionaceae bacterium]|nr:tRNA-dihydrouridine synthase family protein [Pseudobdellovibrionaceae bacterium]
MTSEVKPFFLKNPVNFPLCLAPMVGLSHFALRQLIREYMPQNAWTLWPTEMLNSRRLPFEKVGETPETFRGPDENGLVPQILGNEEFAIAKSLEKLTEWGAEGIDINMGCPVQKALKHNYGVALMGDPMYAAEVVRMTVKHSVIPVSVKLRSVSQGLDESPDKLLEFVERLTDAGAKWITLHPRTAEQKRRDSADWEQIRYLKSKLKCPVIGNGDIQTVDDVLERLKQAQCDVVMSGRALAARPWMVWQLGEALGFESSELYKEKKPPSTPQEEAQEYGRSLLRLSYILWNSYQKIGASESMALRKLKFHIKTTHVWLDYGHALSASVSTAATIEDFQEKVSQFFLNSDLSMTSRTELRQ